MAGRHSYPGIIALALLAVIGIVVWAAQPGGASGAYTDAARPSVVELAPPGIAFSGAAADAGTAFREEDAGLSAYYRVPEPQKNADSGETRPRLDIDGITKALLNLPDESDSVRTYDRVGRLVERGVNFSIVAVPMITASGKTKEAREVTVYYDDRGWIVSYLPPGVPAAAIWRHKAAPGATSTYPIPDAHLEHNLLVLAINVVLDASKEDYDVAQVAHTAVGYYHWEYPDCNALMMFSHLSKWETTRIRFIVPATISHLRASAAALITSGIEGGETTTAKVFVGEDVKLPGKEVAVAKAPDYLVASKFNLARATGESSVHYMWVSVEGNYIKSSAGVVMLLYSKPSS